LVLSAAVFFHNQKGITNILVWEPLIQDHFSVHNIGDFVHKHHHILLQALSGIGEVTNVTKPKTCSDLFTRNDGCDLTQCTVLNHVDGKAYTFGKRLFFFNKFDFCKLEGLMLEKYGAIVGLQVSWPKL
jgi:hypothetical protein